MRTSGAQRGTAEGGRLWRGATKGSWLAGLEGRFKGDR